MKTATLNHLRLFYFLLGSSVWVSINCQFTSQPIPKLKDLRDTDHLFKKHHQETRSNGPHTAALISKTPEKSQLVAARSAEKLECPDSVIQSEDKTTVCGKTFAWVLKHRHIFFISTHEESYVEVPMCDKPSESTIQFINQISQMLQCDVENPEPRFFPAYYSFNQQTLTDVYVSVQQRCEESGCEGLLSTDKKDELIADMLEDYLTVMPRSHYGYDDAGRKPGDRLNGGKITQRCLDETGNKITSLSTQNYAQACFSLWMADKNKKLMSTLNTEYYGGLLGFSRVEQTIFLVEHAKSIPYYFYEKNNLPCKILDEQALGTENLNQCSLFLSAENYGMLCCCYKQQDNCHFPNPDSYHYRAPYQNSKKYSYRLTCGYGNYSYADVKKAAEGEAANVSWMKQENPFDDIKLHSTGDRCTTVYEFNQTNFIMRMGSSSKSDCKSPASKQFLCELLDKVCPGVKNVKTTFSVKCCCGGDREILSSGEERIKPEDLCNLDFLAHRVQDNFERVFNTPICSYSKHYYRLFGHYYKEGGTEPLFCNVYYDISLKKVVYLLDGNNFEFFFDQTYRTKRDKSIRYALVMGNVMHSIKENCRHDDTYMGNEDNLRRVLYFQKCDPKIDGLNCDEAIEREIETGFQNNKDKVMKKCLKYESRKAVIHKTDLETDMASTSSLIHADESFLCFAHIKSTVVVNNLKSPNEKHSVMTHDIKAGPVPKSNGAELRHIGSNDIDLKTYHLWCMQFLNDRRKDFRSEYCLSMNEKNEVVDRKLGNYNSSFFCCCFVGYGWEDCDLKSTIINYVDSHDVIMDEQAILEVYQGEGYCTTEAVQSASSQDKKISSIQDAIRKEKLSKCVQPIGCFRIQDLNDHKPKRFEIWAGCTSNIPRLVTLSAHMRLANLCTTTVFSQVTIENPKCVVVDLTQYFNTDYKSNYNPTDGYPFALVCCCIDNCKGNIVNQLYGLSLNNAAKN